MGKKNSDLFIAPFQYSIMVCILFHQFTLLEWLLLIKFFVVIPIAAFVGGMRTQGTVQAVVQVGLAVTYTVTAGKSLQVIQELFTDGCEISIDPEIDSDIAGVTDCSVNLTQYIFLFGFVQLLLSQIPSFHHLWCVFEAFSQYCCNHRRRVVRVACARCLHEIVNVSMLHGGSAPWAHTDAVTMCLSTFIHELAGGCQ